MNYFTHALPFLDDPYFAAGSGVPDWLSVVDRQVRVRAKHAEPFVEETDGPTAAIARGVVQHVRDDARFHGTRAFSELSLALAGTVRRALNEESGYRPSFLGHLLVELLLDASLIAENPPRLDAYYQAIESVDGRLVEEVVNRMAPRPTRRLVWLISRFCRERILWDYLEDAKLHVRLNQVMRRVGFAPLPDDFRDVLPAARERVDRAKADLLEGIPVPPR
ncbi:MAG: hypothetical protein ACYTG0_21755 [Planctomycetota bacterium]|jgi:hypothetical protein